MILVGVVGCERPTSISVSVSSDLPCSALKGVSISAMAPGAREGPGIATSRCVDTSAETSVGELVLVPSVRPKPRSRSRSSRASIAPLPTAPQRTDTKAAFWRGAFSVSCRAGRLTSPSRFARRAKRCRAMASPLACTASVGPRRCRIPPNASRSRAPKTRSRAERRPRTRYQATAAPAPSSTAALTAGRESMPDPNARHPKSRARGSASIETIRASAALRTAVSRAPISTAVMRPVRAACARSRPASPASRIAVACACPSTPSTAAVTRRARPTRRAPARIAFYRCG